MLTELTPNEWIRVSTRAADLQDRFVALGRPEGLALLMRQIDRAQAQALIAGLPLRLNDDELVEVAYEGDLLNSWQFITASLPLGQLLVTSHQGLFDLRWHV